MTLLADMIGQVIEHGLQKAEAEGCYHKAFDCDDYRCKIDVFRDGNEYDVKMRIKKSTE